MLVSLINFAACNGVPFTRCQTMDKEIIVKDKKFRQSISSDEIQKNVKRVADEINRDYAGGDIRFVGILNGAFIFAADLLKNITVDCNIDFVKVSSYSGTSTTGEVTELIGLNKDIAGKDVIIVEDIIETGITMSKVLKMLKNLGARSVKIAILVFKPESFKGDFKIDYIGFRLPKSFIIGYGFDYDGYYRNLPAIYSLVED